MSTDATKPADAVARESARGAALITFAKAWFLATGFLQPLLLTRLLGKEAYGLYGLALSAVSILNNVVVTGSIQAMSRAVIQGGSGALRKGLVIHVALGVALGLALVAGAGALGEGALHDSRLPSLLRVGAVVVADYAVYAALVGAFNGRRRFGAQAGLDVAFSTMRTALVIGLAATGAGALGAMAGWALASAVITVAALALSRADLRAGAPEAEAAAGDPMPDALGPFARRYARFFAPVLVYQLALNLVLQVDGLLFKAVVARRGATEDAVNGLVGLYKAAQTFAFLPYQLLLAVTFVVFPVVSRAALEGDRERTTRFVEGALRFSALAAGAMIAVLAGAPRGVLLLAYKPEYADGAASLRALSLGQGGFALSVIGTTIVVAGGRTRAATALMLVTLLGVVGGDLAGLALTPGTGAATLRALAVGSAAGWALGLAAVAWYVRSEFGAFLKARTAARVALSVAAAALAAGAMPFHGKAGTLVTAAATVAAYALALVLTGELGADELARVRRVARR